MTAPPFQRPEMLRRLSAEQFDVVVIGGGITGLGVVLDAASRGLSAALVERDDFASGTSSKSSKLIHGGLRYLQQGEVRLVYEALRERRRLRRNAAHLVSVMPFMIPILTKDGLVSRKIARALGSAMWLYDITGGWRIGKIHRRLRKQAALAHLPTMNSTRLASAYLYFDAAADDARLCIAVARTAAAHGAVLANRCPVVEITKDDGGKACGVVVVSGGERIAVRSKIVINAAGVWADDVRALAETTHPDSIRPAKGVHITVPWHKVRNDIAVVIPVPKDKRSLFVVPWGGRADGSFDHAYIGTTDTDYTGDINDPQCTLDDIDYVLRALNFSLTTEISQADITGVWAGLRPLVKAVAAGRTADLSRRHSIRSNDAGVISVTGGKLTTYREMAEDTVDAALEALGRRSRCVTTRLQLVGAAGFREPPKASPTAHLAGRYGTEAQVLHELIAADITLAEPLVAGLPYLRAEALFAVRYEMATTVDDVLTRRTRARLQDRNAAMQAAPDVARLIGQELGWNTMTAIAQAEEFVASCNHEIEVGRTRQDASTTSPPTSSEVEARRT